jgi:hypothetical protein
MAGMDTPEPSAPPAPFTVHGLHDHSADDIAYACRYGHQRYEDVRRMTPKQLAEFNGAISRLVKAENAPVEFRLKDEPNHDPARIMRHFTTRNPGGVDSSGPTSTSRPESTE